MRILIFGVAPWVKTAYGKNTRDLISFLAPAFDVDVASYFGHHGAEMHVGGARVFPCYESFAEMPDWVEHYVQELNADMVLQHFDVWVLPEGWCERISVPVVTYAPVDCSPMHHAQAGASRGAAMNVAMTKFAQRAFARAGMPNVYIPHWVDTKLFRPLDKPTCRRNAGMPEDAFIVGIVGTNKSPRKNIPRLLRAFAAFAKGKNALVYLHTQLDRSVINPAGHDLARLISDLDIAHKTMHTRKERYLAGLPDDAMVELYNCFDVLLHASLGEGFGIPIIEAQACGVPVIVSDFSAMPEVCGDGGIVVPTIEWDLQTNIHQWHRIPSSEAIIDALQRVYDGEDFRERAIANAISFDVSRVAPMWPALFTDLGGQFDRLG